jgi:hypothetical protein
LNCGHKFQNKRRKQKLAKKILKQYIWQRQTLTNLAKENSRSKKWVQRKLDSNKIQSKVRLNSKNLVLIADVTFFSRTNGLIVFREPNLKQNVWWRSTTSEKAELYRMGKKHLEKNNITICAIVLDGRRGIREVFEGIPIQMCHFHQKQIIVRYLTSRPKLEAGKELKGVVSTLTNTTENELSFKLNCWHEKWKIFLKQKTTNPETGKWFYTHKKVRSAYRSLKTNLPYLFTYQKYPELHIPNTTNSLDGFFNRLKGLLNVHYGLSPKRRKRLSIEILKG